MIKCFDAKLRCKFYNSKSSKQVGFESTKKKIKDAPKISTQVLEEIGYIWES